MLSAHFELHLRHLTLLQCIDILKVFQSSQQFISSLSDAQLMARVPSPANALYRLETSASIRCALVVFFEYKRMRRRRLQEQGISMPRFKSTALRRCCCCCC